MRELRLGERRHRRDNSYIGITAFALLAGVMPLSICVEDGKCKCWAGRRLAREGRSIKDRQPFR